MCVPTGGRADRSARGAFSGVGPPLRTSSAHPEGRPLPSLPGGAVALRHPSECTLDVQRLIRTCTGVSPHEPNGGRTGLRRARGLERQAVEPRPERGASPEPALAPTEAGLDPLLRHSACPAKRGEPARPAKRGRTGTPSETGANRQRHARCDVGEARRGEPRRGRGAARRGRASPWTRRDATRRDPARRGPQPDWRTMTARRTSRSPRSR